jgi:hypothetical protein
MDELLEQFLIEGPEQVQQASDDLLVERDRTDMTRVDSALREPPMRVILATGYDRESLESRQ